MKPRVAPCRPAVTAFACTWLILAAVVVPTARGQSATGAIVGTVTDRGGALLPGVTVTLRQVDTGVERTTTTNAQGRFDIPYLPIGGYEVRAELQGFRSTHVSGVLLTIGQQARVDITMELGGFEETVEVKAVAPLVRTEQSAISHVITNAQISALPLNSRDPLSFLTQLPGINDAQGSYMVSGSRAFTTNFQLEGMNITEERNKTPISTPPLDAIAEFEVKANLMTAESGSASSQVSIALKSGTNRFRGSAYEYYRSNRWEAPNYFNTTGEVPQRIRHQYGATLGGPIRRDRAFFFVSYSGNSTDAAVTRTSFVPTEAMRAGDFSALSVPIVNPFTGQRFPNNQIPQELFDPVSLKLLELYPAPNADHPSRNYVVNLPTTSTSQQWIVRGDYAPHASSRLYAFINLSDGESVTPGSAAAFGGRTATSTQRTGVLRHLQIFSSSLTNELSIAGVRSHTETLPQNHGTNWLSTLGITGVPIASDFEAGGMIDAYLPPYLRLRDEATYPHYYVTNNFSIVDNMTWVRGNHSVKAGFDIRRIQLNDRSRPYTRGLFLFNSWPTGNTFASFLLGVPASTWASFPRDIAYLRKWDTGYFVQDTWRVGSNLTLNLGLRYELFTNPVEKYNRLATFDPASGKIIVSSSDGNLPERGIVDEYFTTLQVPLVTSTEMGLPRSLARTDRNNLAPRLGLAYRPFGDDRTVVRGGFGVYYYAMRQFLMLTGANNPPFQVTRNGFSNTGDYLSFSRPFSGSMRLTPATSIYAISPDFKDGRYHNWNLTAEREVGFSTAVRLSYVGNQGFNLNQSIDINFSEPQDDGRGGVVLVRPHPQFSAVRLTAPVGEVSYHGLEVEAIKRHSSGLSFQANWTWGKSIGTADLDNWEPQDTDLRRERARSNFVPAHTVNANVTYDLPFGEGRRFLSDGGWLTQIAGGWSVAMISKFRSGLWFTPFLRHAAVPGGGNRLSGRPDLVGDPNAGPRTADQWFDPLAFAPVPSGEARFGNSPRSVIEGPGLKVIDISTYKSFRIAGSHRLTIRAEVFNVANWVNLNLGSFQQDVTVPAQAGVIRSTAIDARQFQFALRWDF